MDPSPHIVDDASKQSSKPPVVRGARACTVCRAAKMKCVGAEDGEKPCQRCKRANVPCVFEKHRRGRKPGSKLSEASKMLRKLEKGLNSAKMKSQATELEASLSPQYPSVPDSRSGPSGDGQSRLAHTFSSGPPGSHVPRLQLPDHASSRTMDLDGGNDEDDSEQNADGMYPQKLIGKESQRNSFFGTVLGPSGSSGTSGHRSATVSSSHSDRSASYTPGGVQRMSPVSMTARIPDPITQGLMDEETAKMLFDFVFLRLNTFINLFDPELHTVGYVRRKCPFLFTTLLMAGSKYWKPDVYDQCRRLAHKLAVKAFEDSWKSVEVVQAFACLTYWKEPDDTRTWTYIGYACRMAVELELNRYVAKPPEHETNFQRLERRNRERTYLVLFVHDRSLGMQYGRQTMLREDDLVKQSSTWHEQIPAGVAIRPEDVIVSAFVALRRIAAETTEIFNLQRGPAGSSHIDVDYEVLLRGCNAKLMQWVTTWKHEMKRANGQMFHFSFLQFFRLYVRLFINSFGIMEAMSSTNRASPSLQALTACYTSAVEGLRIVTEDFAPVQVLQYGQDSITIMTAYSAVFLLQLLRNPNTTAELPQNATNEIYSFITKTADAYQEAAGMASSSSSSIYHARFLRTLVEKDKLKARQAEMDRRDNVAIDPILQTEQSSYMKYRSSSSRTLSSHASGSSHTNGNLPLSQMYHHQVLGTSTSAEQPLRFPASPHLPLNNLAPEGGMSSEVMRGGNAYMAGVSHPSHTAPQASEVDANYWRTMFREIRPGLGPNLVGEEDYGMYTPLAEPSYYRSV